MRRQEWNVSRRAPLVACAVMGLLAGCSDDPTAPAKPAGTARRGDVAVAAAPVPPTALGPAGMTGTALDINDASVVVGSIRGAGGVDRAVRWQASGTMDTLPLSTAVGVANDGSVAGMADYCRAARWSPASGISYATPQSTCFTVTAIDPWGMHVVGSTATSPQPPNYMAHVATIWVMQPPPNVFLLGYAPGWYGSIANAVNDRATMVGELFSTGFISRQAFMQSYGAPVMLGNNRNSRAWAVNIDGAVVGEQDGRAVRFYAGSTMVDELLPGVSSSSARAINNKGEIVIDAGAKAWLRRGSELVELASLGGCCVWASAVNEKSQVVGWATDATGAQRPVMWDVNAPPPPPLVAFAGGPYFGVEGAPTTFSGGATGGTPPIAFAWSFGDGATATGPIAGHAYADDGMYTATLTATGGAQVASASASATIFNVPPTVSPWMGDTILSGETFTLRARVEDPGANDAPWRWDVRDASGSLLGEGALASVPDSVRAPLVLRRAGRHVLTLSVADKDGGVGRGVVEVDVLRLPVPIAVSPPTLKAAEQGKGLLTVIVYGTPLVDPADIVVASVRLGGGLALASRGNGQPMASLDDVNGDGVRELVLKFRRDEAAERAALTGIDGALVLRADLVDGRQLEGRRRWPSPATGQ